MMLLFWIMWAWAGLTLYYAKRDDLRSVDEDGDGVKIFIFFVMVIFWPLYIVGDIVLGDR